MGVGLGRGRPAFDLVTIVTVAASSQVTPVTVPAIPRPISCLLPPILTSSLQVRAWSIPSVTPHVPSARLRAAILTGGASIVAPSRFVSLAQYIPAVAGYIVPHGVLSYAVGRRSCTLNCE